ncbi:L,D-transpeptidase family protein [Bacillus sp. ISL-35]|nr:L,D-transpeptidase family protein [Bacillus sp. ISL-35]
MLFSEGTGLKFIIKTLSCITILLLFSQLRTYGEKQDDIYIKIDLWSNRLLVFKENEVTREYDISPGNEQTPTPIGMFTVVGKSSGWGGGFGSRWLGLNVPWGDFGIHGTNKPTLIGKNVSSGCIRMRNKDVEELFDMIPQGTRVYIEGPLTGIGEGEFKNIAYGSKGNLVQLVQNRLKAMELYFGPIDGIYDKGTENAVKKFQKLNHLPVTGGVSIREYTLLGLLE